MRHTSHNAPQSAREARQAQTIGRERQSSMGAVIGASRSLQAAWERSSSYMEMQVRRILRAIQTIVGYAELAAMIVITVTISVAVAATLYVAIVAALAAMGIVIVVAFLAHLWGMSDINGN